VARNSRRSAVGLQTDPIGVWWPLLLDLRVPFGSDRKRWRLLISPPIEPTLWQTSAS